MTDHLAAYLGRLEDHHGLQEKGIDETQFGSQFGQRRGAREAVEHRVQIVHGVPQLVECLFHGHDLVAGTVKGSRFKEWSDHIARSEEPVVLSVGLFSG